MAVMPTSYGSGTPTQFTDGTARQVLELGKEIHYFNPHETPILSIAGRAKKNVTPVPVFEWMEDEYFIQRSLITAFGAAQVLDSATAGINDKGVILILDKTSYLENFEVGGVYLPVVVQGSGLDASVNSMLAFLCIAIGKNVDYATPTDKMVQFVGIDTISGDNYTYDKHATTVAVMTGDTGTGATLTLTYAGTAQTGSLSGVNANQATQINLTDNDVFAVYGLTGHAEGAAAIRGTRKKVRRPKNCTQIFRETYDITGTAEAAKMYGPMELSRLQSRKLKKIKSDIEWNLLTRGAIDLDASAENPKRKFQGIGVGNTAGVVQSHNGYSDTDYQFSYSSGTQVQFNAILRNIFEDQLEGSQVKDMFCSPKWLEAMTNMFLASGSKTTLETKQGSNSRGGLRITSFNGPIGGVNLIPHPMLRGSLQMYAVLIDWNNFELRPLRTRDMMLRKDIIRDGSDGKTDEWLIEVGPKIMQEQTHAILKLT